MSCEFWVFEQRQKKHNTFGVREQQRQRGVWFKCSIYWAQANGITSDLVLSTSSSRHQISCPSPVITQHSLSICRCTHYACFLVCRLENWLSVYKIWWWGALLYFVIVPDQLGLVWFDSILRYVYMCGDIRFFSPRNGLVLCFVFTITYGRIIRDGSDYRLL